MAPASRTARGSARLNVFFLLLAPGLAGSSPARRARTVASTLAACSPPITEMRALGHIHRKRGDVGAAAHAVVARAEAAADDER